MIRCIAFDLFGTVFDMSGIPRDQIAAYVEHVRRNDFSPYQFSAAWYNLKPHPDAAAGIKTLNELGYTTCTLSNAKWDLADTLCSAHDLQFHRIIDLVPHRVYKPHIDAYRVVEKEMAVEPEACLMVTANPTFGDIEGAAAIGMKSQVIRHGYPETIVDLAAMAAARTGPFC